MAKYRLTTAHYIGEQYLLEGTEIGDGTPFPFDGQPSMHMELLEGKAPEPAAKAADKKEPLPPPTTAPAVVPMKRDETQVKK